jgi:polyisoprenoid-binding protein YceI
MKKYFLYFAVGFLFTASSVAQTRYITHTSQATIYSHTMAEDITASSNNVTGLINPLSGDVAIAVPVQSFQFEKALMQEHFNQPNFMDSKQYPKISFKGKITDLSAVNFGKDGSYHVVVSGDLSIKGMTKPITEKATIEITGGKIMVASKFVVKDISSYGVGKPMGSKKKNVADDIEVSFNGQYDASNE